GGCSQLELVVARLQHDRFALAGGERDRELRVVGLELGGRDRQAAEGLGERGRDLRGGVDRAPRGGAPAGGRGRGGGPRGGGGGAGGGADLGESRWGRRDAGVVRDERERVALGDLEPLVGRLEHRVLALGRVDEQHDAGGLRGGLERADGRDLLAVAGEGDEC